MSGSQLVEAPPYSTGEQRQVGEVRSVCPQTDRQLVQVGEDPDAQRQVPGERDDGEGLEHQAAPQVEGAGRPGHVGHHQVDQGLVVNQAAYPGDERLG